jgi:hypothetical protein
MYHYARLKESIKNNNCKYNQVLKSLSLNFKRKVLIVCPHVPHA